MELPFKNFFNETKANGIYICDATCESPPLNVLVSGRKLLKMYYGNHALVPQSEVRVILLGIKGSGKTSIVQRFRELEDGQKHYKKEGWTEGISINHIRCGEDGILHVWDFGGQEIMLSTHTLFLRDHCIYIIVLNARQGDEPERWLDYISQYGRNSTVFIVDNHMDEADNFRPDINKMRRMYPNLLDESSKIWEVSCEHPEAFPLNELYGQICTEAKKYLRKEIPLAWNELSVKLSDMKKSGKKVNYITHEDYSYMCLQCGIKESKEKTEVLKWLNEIGVVFTYGNEKTIGGLNEYKILRPDWVTDAIYKIINHVKVQQDNCLITHEQIRESLETGKSENHTGSCYSEFELGFILDVMRKFGLSFRFSDSNEFIPAVADNKEFKEVAEWTEDKDGVVLDMVYQISPMKLLKYQESNVNVTQFYQVIIQIVKEWRVFPRMWRTGALFSDIGGFGVLLFLQNKGRWNNELRLIIKGKPENRERAAKLQWGIMRYLRNIANDYEVDAKVLIVSSEGEHYFSIEKAFKIALNSPSFEYYDSNLDLKIDLLEDVISKVIPNMVPFWEKSFIQLQNMVREGISKTDEALIWLQKICELQMEERGFFEEIIHKMDHQDEQWFKGYAKQLYNSEELWSLCSEIQRSGDLQNIEFGKIRQKLEELLEKQPQEKSWKESVINCISLLSSIVTLGTADYGKGSEIINILKTLGRNIIKH